MLNKAGPYFYIALAAVVLLDVFPERDHPVFWWHDTPAFDAVFGIVACLLIIKGSKLLAKIWLKRGEEYYD